MEAWEVWFYELLRTGDADPGFALVLKEKVAVCVQALCSLQGNMKTFKQFTPTELLARFPHEPASTSQPPWQQDQEYRRKTQALLNNDDWYLLLRELLGFLQLLETAPSVALPTQPPPKNQSPEKTELSEKAKAKRKRGRKPDTDLKEEQRIVAAWKTGRHKTYEECASALGRTPREISRAVDNNRHRKRKERKPKLAPE